MIINHNLQAMNANRQMGANATTNQASMEKLSSGLRINRAGDDAAGLSISEKMRAQINGLNQASRNAQDGISMIQTTEGALDETHSILQRMRELSVQATTDTNDDQDRQSIQDEIDALTEEITRISDTTEFNGKNLLDSEETVTLQVGANADQHIDVNLKEMSASTLLGGGGSTDKPKYIKATINSNNTITQASIDLIQSGIDWDLGLEDGDKVGSENAKLLAALGTIYVGGGSEKEFTLRTSTEIKAKPQLTKDEMDFLLQYGNARKSVGAATSLTNGSMFDSTTGQIKSNVVNKVISAFDKGITSYNTTNGESVTFGDEVTVTTSGGGSGVDVTTSDAANTSISTLDDAIKKVSEFRSELGAVQNRLEHTISNLDNAAENTQAAESRIRDVDMAEEMMEFTKTNVLQQAAQSMLAQANQKPNQVLQLLG